MGHFGRRIRWKHSFLRPAHLEVKIRSKAGQIRLNRQTQNFHSESCLYCPVLPQDSKKWQFFMYDDYKCPKTAFQKQKKIVTALFQNPWAQVKFFLTARRAVDTESSDVETTSIASVVFPLLISATFRAVLNQCAVAGWRLRLVELGLVTRTSRWHEPALVYLHDDQNNVWGIECTFRITLYMNFAYFISQMLETSTLDARVKR